MSTSAVVPLRPFRRSTALVAGTLRLHRDRRTPPRTCADLLAENRATPCPGGHPLRQRAWSLTAALVFCGCGGGNVVSTSSPPDADASTADDAPASMTADGAAEVSTKESGAKAGCPAVEPAQGLSCVGTIDCAYSDSVRPDCRDRWSCRSGQWAVATPPCPQAPPGYCPSGQPSPSTSCTPMTDPSARAECEYPGNIFCQCVCPNSGANAGCAATEQWVCWAPPAIAGCPSVVPNLGTACTVQGTQCTYGDPCNVGGVAVYCQAGIWQVGQVTCSG